MNKIKKSLLANKIPLFVVPVPGAKTATVLVMAKTGSRYEKRTESGLSHFLEHMFFKGTHKRPNTSDLSSELDSLGGEHNAFTGKEYTGYWVKVAGDKLHKAIEIVSDMLLNSKFEEEEIDRERGVIIEELNMYQDNPLMRIEDVFEECLYGDTPAGWDTIGTKENIRAFKRQDFINYLKTQYGSRSLYIILAGAVKDADKRAAARAFQSVGINRWRDKLAVKDKQSSPQIKIQHKKVDQAVISLGVRTVPVGHKDEFAIKLLSVILGGAMSSRLFIRLRERSGLAYFVRTNTEFYSDSGYLATTAGVPTKQAKQAVKIILEEYRRLTEEAVTAAELKRAKDLFRGRALIQLESSDSLANWYGRQAILRSSMLTPAEFLKRLSRVTPQDLKTVAKKIFVSRNLNLAAVGDLRPADFKSHLKF